MGHKMNLQKATTMKQNHVFLGFLLLLVLPLSGLGQAYTFSGEVRDANTNEPLVGASVLLNGTSQGTTTDASGRFELQRIENEKIVLVVSYLGYETQNWSYNFKTDRNKNRVIALKLSAFELGMIEVEGQV